MSVGMIFFSRLKRYPWPVSRRSQQQALFRAVKSYGLARVRVSTRLLRRAIEITTSSYFQIAIDRLADIFVK